MSTALNEAVKAADLPADVRAAVRDLILVLADSKRLLGMRYGNWILGAPELEAGIACASMAQDEWGHARLLYALLRDFDEDVDRLEHGRQAHEYRSIEVLDREPQSWPELVVINALVDAALTLQLEALAHSSYLPLRQRVQKLIDEEAFHAAHGAAWMRRIGGAGAAAQRAMQEAAAAVLPAVLRWFGPDSDSARKLQQASIVHDNGSGMRTRFFERIAPLLRHIGAAADVSVIEPDFAAFDEATRRSPDTVPDERTIAQVRGDLNRAFLMD
jgi:ring-1,2-phenylacetyl-CoA epoxidase subunit PaaC